jgi:hypothetical protein
MKAQEEVIMVRDNLMDIMDMQLLAQLYHQASKMPMVITKMMEQLRLRVIRLMQLRALPNQLESGGQSL